MLGYTMKESQVSGLGYVEANIAGIAAQFYHP